MLFRSSAIDRASPSSSASDARSQQRKAMGGDCLPRVHLEVAVESKRMGPTATNDMLSVSARGQGAHKSRDSKIGLIARCLPKFHRPFVIRLDQGRNSSHTPAGECLLRSRHERSSNSASPMVWVNRQAVDISPPTIECRDDGSDDARIDLRHQAARVIVTGHALEVCNGVHLARGRDLCSGI